LRLSYFDVSPERRGNTFLLEENNIIHLASFEKYNISRQDGEGINCNWVICSPREYKAYFYSRFVGAAEQCAFKSFSNDKRDLIPHKIWLTYKNDILKDKEPLRFYENIQKISKAYRSAWGEPDAPIEVLNYERCVKMITTALMHKKDDSVKVLLNYFSILEMASKADICRIAVLYLYGGYYFGIEIDVVEPFIASPEVSFVTVENRISKVFFQAFIASSPKHPILADNLNKLVLVARGKLTLTKYGPEPEQFTFLGPETLRLSYFDISSERRGSTFLLQENNIIHLASFEKYKISRQDGEGINCNWVVCSPRDYKVYFYSRFVGATVQCRRLYSIEYPD